MDHVLLFEILGPGYVGMGATLDAPKGKYFIAQMCLSSQSLGHVDCGFRVVQVGVVSPSL